MSNRYVIGIDLGTTNCALATRDIALADEDARIDIRNIAQVVNAGEVAERPLLPSFLYLPGDLDFPAGSTALPWDRIQPTRFRPDTALAAQMNDLRAHQQARAANDPEFRYLLSDIAAVKEIAAQKSVSLNLNGRVAENKRLDEGRLTRENARRTALGQEPLTSLEQLDDTATSDAILLHQAAQIVAEIAEKRPGQ